MPLVVSRFLISRPFLTSLFLSLSLLSFPFFRDVALLELAPFADPSPEDDEEIESLAASMDPEEEADREFDDEGGGDDGEEPAVVAIASPSSSSSSSPSTSSSSPQTPSRRSPAPKTKNLRPRPPLVPLRRGTSAGLEVGQTVYAIGNPFGLSSTLTKGVLSGVGREIASGITGRPLENVLQSDAAINPGKREGEKKVFFFIFLSFVERRKLQLKKKNFPNLSKI